MEELDEWTQRAVVDVLASGNMADGGTWPETVLRVKKSIRAKVLESYRNGQAAAPKAQPGERTAARR